MMIPTMECDLREVLVTATRSGFARTYRKYRLLLDYLAASTTSANPDRIPTREELSSQWGKACIDQLEIWVLDIERETHLLANKMEAKVGTTRLKCIATPNVTDVAQIIKDIIQTKPMRNIDPRTPILFTTAGARDAKLEQKLEKYRDIIDDFEDVLEDAIRLRRGTMEINSRSPPSDDPHLLGWRLDSTPPFQEEDEAEETTAGPLGGFEDGRPLSEAGPHHHNSVVKLKVFFPSSGPQTFTGWLASPHTVITAAQNLYNVAKGFAQSVQVLTPTGDIIHGAHATLFWYWYKYLDVSADAAAIRLSSEYPNAQPLKYRFLPQCAATSLEVTMRGFLETTAIQQYDKDTMYEGETSLLTELEETGGLVVHDVSTGPASAGSPFIDNGGYVAAMHHGRVRLPRRDCPDRGRTAICAVHFDRYSCNPLHLQTVLDYMQDPTSLDTASIISKPMRAVAMPGRLCRFLVQLL
ncbi:hypothetical protein QBC44DRAFT_166281 [Cladorrhinum sp. PSN332]|nr:hypothetical protein QBC44DRAFT_166281 [Cladorrhinum sp. PSN332]